MILIVADAGPVNYLIQTGHVGVLAVLAGRVVLPVSVRAKLLHRAAPDAVRAWASALGVVTMGTVGILEAAAARGLVALPGALEKLRATSCFLSEEIIGNALRRDAERSAR